MGAENTCSHRQGEGGGGGVSRTTTGDKGLMYMDRNYYYQPLKPCYCAELLEALEELVDYTKQIELLVYNYGDPNVHPVVEQVCEVIAKAKGNA